MVVNSIRPPSSAGNGKIFITARFTESSAIKRIIIVAGTDCSTIETKAFHAPIGPERLFFASSRTSAFSAKNKFHSVFFTNLKVNNEE